MTTNNTTRTESMNRVNNNNIADFGAKIGGARKDMYQAAREWAERLADITADQLAAVGLSKLVRLPNLEKLTEAGAITPEAARAALCFWRTIERKPTYGVTSWAERTRATLEAIAAVLTNADQLADIIADRLSNAAEYKVLTAANWPAEPFTFGKYRVKECTTVQYYGAPAAVWFRICDTRYYIGKKSQNPADIADQLRTMTARDEEKAADRRAQGPKLSVYKNRAGQYFIAPEGRAEIVLKTYETSNEAFTDRAQNRAALVERYNAMKNFPDCRREWNRPRVGEDWREGENMTPEAFAAALPFRGVEFGNWVSQTERAALLNSAFDGFHDLAAVLGIAPAAVCLNGELAFAFASRGHSGAAAHYEPARRVINLTKKNGAGCMAHEWFHAVDNMAAGGGVNNYATEHSTHPAAFAILQAIKKTDYYTRSERLAKIKENPYWTSGRELTARAFEGVCAVLLNAAGICSDFLVNCISMDEFSRLDVEHRADYYPYPTADEAAALLPLYVQFLREVFGAVTVPAAALTISEAAAAKAEADRIEAERIRAERLAAYQAQQEAERRAAEERAAREAEELKNRTAATVDALREVLTARHFADIATAYTSAAVYAVCHLEGEVYTIKVDINATRADIEAAPMTCRTYKYCASARRIINRPNEIKCNLWRTAAELCQGLQGADLTAAVIDLAERWDYRATAANVEHAAKIYADTMRARAALSAPRKAEKAAEKPATATTAAETANTPANAQNADSEAATAPADGLTLEDIAGGVAVTGNSRTTYRHRRDIKAHGCTWNRDAQRWEATTPEAVAAVRAWFGLTAADPTDTTTDTDIQSESEGTETPATAPTLQQAGEITAPAANLPEWLTVGARVRTRGRYMMSNRSSRPQWVEGEEMEITAITAEWVDLKSDTSRESISTATAAENLTPVNYTPSETSQTAEPLAVAASLSTAEGTAAADATLQEAGEITHSGHRFEMVTEWPESFFVWPIGRKNFPFAGWLPLCELGRNEYEWQCNINTDTLKAIYIGNEAAALACLDAAIRGKANTRADFLAILKDYDTDPTDPTPEPSGEGEGTAAEDATLYEAGEITAPAAESENNGGNLFTVNGETFRYGDRVTINATTDGHTTTEAGTLTDYARGQALAEVTTDDGRKIYGFFGSVKHAPTYPTPSKGDGAGDGTQADRENEPPVIEDVKNYRISKAEDGISTDGIEVTNPIKADDLNTPRVLQLSEHRDIVTGCTPEQAGELERMGGKRTAAGVVFRASKHNRDRLHIWQNEQSRKERAAILGDGWQWIEGINNGTEPGDEIICIDGTRGRVTKGDGEHCCIEFETEDGQHLSVAGYFRKNCEAATLYEAGEITETAEGVKVGDTVKHNKHEEVATVTAIREVFVNRADGYRYLYTLDFGQSVKGPFDVELNGGEFLRDAFTPCTTDGRELLPEPPAEITIDAPTLYEASEISAEIYVTTCNGIAQDAFKAEKMEAMEADLHRHVYNTLVGCCRGVVTEESPRRYVVNFPQKGGKEVCEIVAYDPENIEHVKCCKAYGLVTA